MKTSTHAIRLTPVSAAALMALAGLLPQHAVADETVAAADQPATAADKAAPATGAATKLQEIVITSQKRTERVKDTPVAAAVMSGDALQEAAATDISDLNKLVPSVQLKGTFNGRVPLSIRGVSTNANEATVGLTSGVSIMIDGVPVPSDSTDANELADIASLEVLKGPQSTLGGRTASAGVINFVTKAPTKRWTGDLALQLTSDKERRVNGFISGPINDVLAFSVSLFGNYREYPIHNLMLGQTSFSDNNGGRAKLLLHPDKDLDITLAAHSANIRSTGGTFTYQYLTPGAALFPYINGTGVNQATALPGVTPGYGNMNYASPVQSFNHTRDDDISLNIEKRFGGYTFTSTTAHQSERQNLQQDVSINSTYFLNGLIPGPPPFYNVQPITLVPTSLSQEFRIASPLGGFMSYVAGLFYSDVKVHSATNRAMFVNWLIDDIHSDSKSLGLYGRATWNLSASTSLLTGLRLNRDDISYSIADYGYQHFSSGSDSSNATAADLTLRQKFGEDKMVYATLARGYKPKAYDTGITLQNNDTLTPANKEDINHIELGAKATLLDGALQINAAVFNTQYKHYQVQVNDNTQIIAALILANAGEARTRGLELDATLAAGERTRLNLGMALINSQFVNYQGAPCYNVQTVAQGCTADVNGKQTQDLSGKDMPNSPKVKINLGVDHDLAQTVVPWDLHLNALYSYQGKTNFQPDQNPQSIQPAFGILNLSAKATSPNGRHAITFFVNNATNKYYNVNEEDFFSGLWAVPTNPGFAPANAVIGQPARDAKRYTGIRYNFYFD